VALCIEALITAELAMTDLESQISKLERGERRLDIVDYLRICRAIGRDPGEPLRSFDLGRAARK
jgi:hypothetical protein